MPSQARVHRQMSSLLSVCGAAVRGQTQELETDNVFTVLGTCLVSSGEVHTCLSQRKQFVLTFSRSRRRQQREAGGREARGHVTGDGPGGAGERASHWSVGMMSAAVGLRGCPGRLAPAPVFGAEGGWP